MQLIPLTAVPSQTFAVALGNQTCQLNIYQKTTGLFCDVYADADLIIGGVICLNQVLIVRDIYLGFIGDLAFFDTQSDTDPVYTGLGGQYQLGYLTADEVARAQANNAAANLAAASSGSFIFGFSPFGVSAF